MSRPMPKCAYASRLAICRAGRKYSKANCERRCFSVKLSTCTPPVDEALKVSNQRSLPLKALVRLWYTSASTPTSTISATAQRYSSTHANIAMSQKDSSSEANWQSVAKRKKEEQAQRIPNEWKLNSFPGAHVKSYTDIPRKSGLLTKKELDITERYDAVALAEAIKTNKLTCIDVTRAFCKVCPLKPHLRFSQQINI